MTLLVTAAGGHLGRLTVQALLARGTDPAEVVATARDLSSVADLAALGVDVRHADHSDPATLTRAFAGVDRLLLVSGNELGQRVAQHAAVVDAAVAAGVSFVAYTSAPQAGTASYLLAADHRATEEHLAASGVPSAVLRNGWYVENWTGTLGTALALGAVHGAAGEGRVSATPRADLAEAAAVVLAGGDHDGRTYELGGDEPFTMAEYAATLTEVSGREVRYVDLDQAAYTAVLEQAGLPAEVAHVLADSDLGIRRGELLSGTRDLSGLIGRPTTPLADALRAALPSSTGPATS